MKALVTGFEPFGGDGINPSSLALPKLKKRIRGVAVHTAELPCSFAHSAAALRVAIAEVKPDIVLCVGLAGGRAELCLERVAINVQDARIRDTDGKQPIEKPVVKAGPAAHFATLPVKACVAEMRKAGLPAAVSNTAGTFVCNHIFYALMHRIATQPALAHTRGGFVHVPYLPEQAASKPGFASMALAAQVEAFRVAIRTALTVRDDVRETGGRLH